MKTQRWQYGGARAGVFLMAALINGVAAAAPGDLLFTLTAPEPQAGGFFGFVVSSMDSDVLVSERNRFTLPIDARGRAYIFDGQTGQVTWIFDNPEPTDQDQFAARSRAATAACLFRQLASKNACTNLVRRTARYCIRFRIRSPITILEQP